MSPEIAGGRLESNKPITEASRVSLWDIESGLNELMEAREEAETEDARVAVDQALTEYVNREVAKVDRIRAYLLHCEAMERAAKEESERQAKRAKAWADRSQRLKTHCIAALQAFGKQRIEGKTGKLVVKANGGKLPLIIEDEAAIPSEFKPAVVTYPVDKDALRTALANGNTIAGAKLGERGIHLEVR